MKAARVPPKTLAEKIQEAKDAKRAKAKAVSEAHADEDVAKVHEQVARVPPKTLAEKIQ